MASAGGRTAREEAPAEQGAQRDNQHLRQCVFEQERRDGRAEGQGVAWTIRSGVRMRAMPSTACATTATATIFRP